MYYYFDRFIFSSSPWLLTWVDVRGGFSATWQRFSCDYKETICDAAQCVDGTLPGSQKLLLFLLWLIYLYAPPSASLLSSLWFTAFGNPTFQRHGIPIPLNFLSVSRASPSSAVMFLSMCVQDTLGLYNFNISRLATRSTQCKNSLEAGCVPKNLSNKWRCHGSFTDQIFVFGEKTFYTFRGFFLLAFSGSSKDESATVYPVLFISPWDSP